MAERRDWLVGLDRFAAFQNALPQRIDEDCVGQYHAILEFIETSTHLSLERFKIDPNKVTFVIAAANQAFSYPPRKIQYSNKKYCDREYFCQKVHSLREFLDHVTDAHI